LALPADTPIALVKMNIFFYKAVQDTGAVRALHPAAFYYKSCFHALIFLFTGPHFNLHIPFFV